MKTADCPIEREIEARIDAARLMFLHAPTSAARRRAWHALKDATDRRTPAMKARMEVECMARIEEGG